MREKLQVTKTLVRCMCFILRGEYHFNKKEMHKATTDFNAGKWIKLIKDCSDIDSKMVGQKKNLPLIMWLNCCSSEFTSKAWKKGFSLCMKNCANFFSVFFYSLARYDELSKMGFYDGCYGPWLMIFICVIL